MLKVFDGSVLYNVQAFDFSFQPQKPFMGAGFLPVSHGLCSNESKPLKLAQQVTEIDGRLSWRLLS